MLRPQLITFLTVCETGSFTKAAAALYVTPSAVLQQIRALESDFSTPLLIRSSRGVRLTPAGELLRSRAWQLQQLSDETRREIAALASAKNRIVVGSSIMEKVRLLYELWVLYAQQEQDCEIQMVNIDLSRHIPPPETDLIESINSGVPWMQEWAFFEICRVPFGFAVPAGSPLSEKTCLTIDDLRHETVLTLNSGTSPELAALMDCLRAAGIPVVEPREHESNMIWGSAFRREVFLVPMVWSDILIGSTVLPFEPAVTQPYGIFYRPSPSDAVRRFLDFIRATYREGNSQGIVPVL